MCFEDAFEAFLGLTSPIVTRVEKFRVGLGPGVQSDYETERDRRKFHRFTNIRVLNITAAVLCPHPGCKDVIQLHESLPPKLEQLRLQEVLDLDSARALFRVFRQDGTLPALKHVTISSTDQEVVSHVCGVRKGVGVCLEIIDRGGVWLPFGTVGEDLVFGTREEDE